MSTAGDQDHVDRDDERALRMFLRASQRGDEAARVTHWNELVELNFDRVVGMVKSYSRGHLSAVERDEAIQRALIKLTEKMIDTFNGRSIGEWVMATHTLVKNMCIDVQRGEARHSKHLAHVKHTEAGEADQPARLDSDVYAAIEKARRERESAEDDAEAIEHGRRFLDWAVPKLSRQRRAVLELDRRGLSVEHIQTTLGISRDVVYACRSRALKDLAKLREDYTP